MAKGSLNQSYFYAYDYHQGWNWTYYFSFWNDFNRDLEWVKYIESSGIFLCALMGLTSNLAFLCLYGKSKDLRTVPNVMIANIAVTNILLVPVIMIPAASRLQDEWEFGQVGCKGTVGSLPTIAFIKIWLMTVLSIDRYRRILVPMKKQIGLRFAQLLCVLCWAVPTIATLAIAIPNSMAKTIPAGEHSIVICTVAFDYHPTVRLALVLLIGAFLFNFIIPLLVLAVCYIQILLHLRKNNLALSRHNVFKSKLLKSNNKKRRSIIILITMLCLFLLAWLPFFLALAFVTVDTVLETFVLRSQFFMLILFILGLSSIVDPIVYAFVTEKARRVMKDTFRRKTIHHSGDSSDHQLNTSVSKSDF